MKGHRMHRRWFYCPVGVDLWRIFDRDHTPLEPLVEGKESYVRKIIDAWEETKAVQDSLLRTSERKAS